MNLVEDMQVDPDLCDSVRELSSSTDSVLLLKAFGRGQVHTGPRRRSSGHAVAGLKIAAPVTIPAAKPNKNLVFIYLSPTIG